MKIISETTAYAGEIKRGSSGWYIGRCTYEPLEATLAKYEGKIVDLEIKLKVGEDPIK